MRVSILATCLALATAGMASASHAVSDCDSDVHTIDAGSETFYLVVGPDDSVWIYYESNGHEGLQRGGDSLPGFGSDDPCMSYDPVTGEFVESDFVIF